MTAAPLPVIAIDGPAASGKGTLARRLAGHFGFDHLDTGQLYRAVGLAVLESGADPADPLAAERAAAMLAATPAIPAKERLRADPVADAASKVSAVPAVRRHLLDLQRSFAASPPGRRGAVLDGRDIGTVICPDAPVKIFVTADLPCRAERRFKELQASGLVVIHKAVLADLEKRDARDSQRSVSPLAPAAGAFVLDTSALTADEAFARALAHVQTILPPA